MPERRTPGAGGAGADRARVGPGGRPATARPGPVVTAVELGLLLRRRRVWLCWALLCALPALVAVLLAVTGLAPPPGRGGAFLSAVVSNGQLFPAAALALVLPGVPADHRRDRRRRRRGRRGERRHPALPAGPPGRPAAAAGGQAGLGHGVRAARGAVRDGDRLRRRGRALRLRRRRRAGGAGGVTSLSGAVLSPAELLGRTALVVGYLALCMLRWAPSGCSSRR